MKKLFILIAFMAMATIAYCTDVSGTINANTTWDLAGSPYVVTGNVTVAATYTLTIDAGVEVKFDNSRSLFVYGNVNATNTTFTSNDGSPTPGKWNYLTFYNGSSSTLTACEIKYGQYIDVQAGASLTITGGTIESMYYYGFYNGGTINVSNAVIDLAGFVTYGYGIYSHGSSITSITNTSILNCERGIYVHTDNAQVTINSSTLSSNVYPLFFGNTGELTVTGSNTFTGNTYNVFYIYHTSMATNWSLPLISVPYYFRTNFTVNNGSTLTISSENILKFTNNANLYVRGKLLANAGVGQNIYFTSYRDDNWGGDSNNDGTATAPAVGNWYGVAFYDESDDASIMRRCMLRYAGQSQRGGLTLYDASPTIDYCDFSQNYFGAYFQYNSNPTFTNNTIGSSSLTPIAMSFEANPTFTNNVLSFSDNQYDAIGLIGGTLTANANIIQRDFTTVSNITYLMLAGITVPSAYTLTIDPGIVIKSTSYSYRIIIEGKLVADGTAADKIVFTSVKDDNHGNPGDTNKDGTITTPAINDMGAIIFKEGSDPTSVLDYVVMKYASVYSYYYSNGGGNHYLNACAVATINSSPTISNCEFRELHYGVSCYTTSNPTISNNTMTNITYTPFSISASANPSFSGNTFTNVGLSALGLLGHNVVVNSNIIQRTVAGYTNITYVSQENIELLNGATLDIAAGVVIKMPSSRGWDIQGGFKCNGTMAQHVVFTSLYDDNAGNPMDTNGDGNATTPSWGDWLDISFEENSDDAYCDLVYTDMQYGGGGNHGIITTTNASPSLNNVLIDQSYYYGLWFNGNSAPTVNNVAITNCRLDPIAISLTSNPTFSNISFSANGSNGIRIIEGTLSSDATLVKRNIGGFTNIAYIIDDLNIASGAVLTLEEGIIIKFSGSYFRGIYVHGGLNATGTSGDKIIFTSIKDDSAGGDTNNDGNSSVPAHSDWHGILFYEESDDTQNKLIYAEVRYTGGGYSSFLGSNTTNGSVRIKDAYVDIDHSIIQQSSSTALGIYGAANPDITNCQFYNINYEPIYMAMFSDPVFSGNTTANIGRMAIGIQNETYSQTATIPQRNFAGYTNITYLLYGATINSGTTITIPAGTIFKSTSNVGLIVNGELDINGTVGSPVVFTDYRDDDYGNPMDTEGNGSGTTPTTSGCYIQFNDVSDDVSSIDHAIMRYSTNMIRLNSASPSLTNNTFYKVDYGITNSGVCAPIINNNVFDDLDYAPLSISLVSFPASTSGNIISGATRKGIRVKNETLTQDAVLQKRPFGGISNIPYIFDDYTIGTGVTLTIDPGVICKFWNYGSMEVNNGLIAEGLATSGNRIVFTSLTDDFYGGDTNADGEATASDYWRWYGITVNAVAIDPLTRFENCIFRYTRSNYGAIRTINSSPSILNCSFNNNYRGVYATGASDPLINYCDFYDITYEAVNNLNPSFVIDAQYCWWGDNSGPTHSGNPGGTGEVVTDDVDYNPWGTSGAIIPLLGDVSLNSIVQAYDASLVLQQVVGPPFLNTTQLGVADVSGTAGVTAFDASLILQYVVGLINYFPAALLNPVPNVVSEVKLIVGNEDVEPGEIFNLPLHIAEVSGLYAMNMIITYNPEYLQVLNVESLLSNTNVLFDIDNTLGQINIAFAGVESLENNLQIANVEFNASENIAIGVTTPVEAKFFMANETDLSWNVSNGNVSINGFATGLNTNVDANANHLSCYPNPFKDQINIHYKVSEGKHNVVIAIYDVYGELVAEIANGIHDAADYKISWNGNDHHGVALPSGNYFIRMISQNKVTTQKVQIIK